KKEYIKFLQSSMKAAQKINAKTLTIHSNALDKEGNVKDFYNELTDTHKICTMYDTLLKCVKLAEKYDVSLNLEPLNIYIDHKGNYLKSTQTAAEIIKLIDSPRLKILYDIYHMQINEGNLTYNMDKYWNEIGHVHIADVPGRHEPGTGEINYKYIYKLLHKYEYKGCVGYELFPKKSTKQAVKAIKSFRNIDQLL